MTRHAEPIPDVSEVEAANVAWVDYEPPETAGAQTHRAAMLQKHAFVAGFIAAMQSRSIPDVEGLVERLERRETSASKYGGYALVNPDGPEAATALLTLAGERDRLREAVDKYGAHHGGCRMRVAMGQTCVCGWSSAHQALGGEV